MDFKLSILTRNKHNEDELYKSTDNSEAAHTTLNVGAPSYEPSAKCSALSRKMTLLKKKIISEHDDCSVTTSSTVSLSSLESTTSINSFDSSFSDDSTITQTQTVVIEEDDNYDDTMRGQNNKKSNKRFKSSKPKQKKKPKKKKPKKEKKVIVLSKEEKEQYLAMDCEMVGIGPNGFASAVARVSIVNWDHEVILDTYVQVNEPITDYRTKVSGITSTDIESEEAMDFDSCRELVKHLLKDRILVGHGLKNDLQALNIGHPWYMIRDTVKYEPYMKLNFEGNLAPRRLRDLSLDKLDRTIQEKDTCHDSIIDAEVAMDLYKKGRKRWDKLIEWKKNKSSQIIMNSINEQ